MSALPPARVSALNLYEGYSCRHAGVCCTAGWDIPVEPERAAAVAQALATGRLRAPGAGGIDRALVFADGLPAGACAVTGRGDDGACVFFDRMAGRLCTIHGAFGPTALPAACRHFPRQYLLDDAGVRIAFSHVCPTAAGLLFRDDLDRLHPVDAASIVPDVRDVEGFDARGAIPPLLKPRLAGDFATLRTWDEFVLAACGHAGESPLQVLARLVTGAEHVRNWTPAKGGLQAFVDEGLSESLVAQPARVRAESPGTRRLVTAVQAATPVPLRDHEPDAATRAVFDWDRRPDTWRTTNRYLAARAWGAWSAYLGEGLRTQLACLAAALALVGRHLAEAEDAGAARLADVHLLNALRAADERVVHRADTGALCRLFGDVERLPFGPYAARLGLVWAE